MPTSLPSPAEVKLELPDGASEEKFAGITSALVIWMVTSAMIAWFEFSIFWNLPLLLFAMNLSTFDQVLVVWSLWARILLVTSPAIAVVAWAHYRERGKGVRFAAWTWHFFVLVWLIVDCGLQCVTGASLWHYVEKAMVTEDLALGGDVTAITEGVQEALWVTGVRMALLFTVCHFAFNALAKSGIRDRLRKTALTAAVLPAIAIGGIVGAREFVQQKPALEQLYGTIAFPAWLFHPDRIAEYGTAAFGKECIEEFSDVAEQLHRLTKAPQDSQFLQTTEGRDDAAIRTASLDYTGLLNFPHAAEYQSRPNIVVLFTESIRYDAFCEEHTPKLSRWMKQGMVSEKHFTNSNCSELGAFACMYSQFPLCYDDTLNREISSAASDQLKGFGYERQLITSCSVNFSRMNEFLGPLNFDRTSIHSPKGNPWHDNDKRTLAEISAVVSNSKSPQFVFSILMATHYSYDYPPEYDANPPACVPPLRANPTNADVLRDRYWKAMAFLDEQFDEFLKSVAGTNTIVVITGDHGESFLDDGFLCHGTRLSDIQSRAPLMIVGPGVPAACLEYSSSHVDLFPTLLHLVAGRPVTLPVSHGQSLLTLNEDRGQFLTQAHTNSWDVLMVHNDGRLGLKIPRDSHGTAVMGFFDRNGRVDLSQQKTPADISEWKHRLLQLID